MWWVECGWMDSWAAGSKEPLLIILTIKVPAEPWVGEEQVRSRASLGVAQSRYQAACPPGAEGVWLPGLLEGSRPAWGGKGKPGFFVFHSEDTCWAPATSQ